MKIVRSLLTVGMLVASATALEAKELHFNLSCSQDSKDRKIPKEIAQFKMVKISKPVQDAKEDAPKWENSYALEVHLKGETEVVEVYPFKKAISGDEDYSEFPLDVSDKDGKRINVQTAYIQYKFAWVGLIDNEGFSYVRCEPKPVK